MSMDSETGAKTPVLDVRLGEKKSKGDIGIFYVRTSNKLTRCYICRQFILPKEVYSVVYFDREDLDKFWFDASRSNHTVCLNCLFDFFEDKYKELMKFVDVQPQYSDIINLSRRKQIIIVRLIRLFNRGASYKDYKLYKYPELFIEEVLLKNIYSSKFKSNKDAIFVKYDNPKECPFDLETEEELDKSMFKPILHTQMRFYNEYGFPVDAINIKVMGYLNHEKLYYYLCFTVILDENNYYNILVRLGV